VPNEKTRRAERLEIKKEVIVNEARKKLGPSVFMREEESEKVARTENKDKEDEIEIAESDTQQKQIVSRFPPESRTATLTVFPQKKGRMDKRKKRKSKTEQ